MPRKKAITPPVSPDPEELLAKHAAYLRDESEEEEPDFSEADEAAKARSLELLPASRPTAGGGVGLKAKRMFAPPRPPEHSPLGPFARRVRYCERACTP